MWCGATHFGQIGAGLAADGNNNGQIDAADYDVWRANFGKPAIGSGATAGSPSSALPEPMSALSLLMA